MRTFKGITFVSARGEETFHPSIERPNPPRGKEYELFIQAACTLADAISNGDGDLPILGDVCPSRLEALFFGGDYHLAREQEKIDGFPDFVLVKDGLVVIVDHFKVDASKALGSLESPRGTEYMRFRGNYLRSIGDGPVDLGSLERAIAEKGIEFSTSCLACNIAYHYGDKIKKIDKYKARFREHVCSGLNEDCVEEDLRKPVEVWLMIEDVSPCCGFQFVGKALAGLLSRSQSVDGLIYISNPHPKLMFSRKSQVALIANDKRAIQQLVQIDD